MRENKTGYNNGFSRGSGFKKFIGKCIECHKSGAFCEHCSYVELVTINAEIVKKKK